MTPEDISEIFGGSTRPVKVKFLGRDNSSLSQNNISFSGHETTSNSNGGTPNSELEISDTETPETANIKKSSAALISEFSTKSISKSVSSARRPGNSNLFGRDNSSLSQNNISFSGHETTSNSNGGTPNPELEISDTETPETANIKKSSAALISEFPINSFDLQNDREKKRTIKLLRNKLFAMGHSPKAVMEIGKRLAEPVRDKHKKEREAAQIKKLTFEAYKKFFDDSINMNCSNLTPIMLARARIKLMGMLQQLQTPKGALLIVDLLLLLLLLLFDI